MRTLLCCCGLLLAVGPALAQAPDSSSLKLIWTATGDDSLDGRAWRYEVRYRVGELSDATWNSAPLVPGPPKPSPAGMSDSMIVTGLQPGTPYVFGLKVFDERGNGSPLATAFGVTYPTAGVDDGWPVPLRLGPNPFRNRLVFTFTLVTPGVVTLEIFDLEGRSIERLSRRMHDVGKHTVAWNADGVPPGMYWYRWHHGRTTISGRIVHLN